MRAAAGRFRRGRRRRVFVGIASILMTYRKTFGGGGRVQYASVSALRATLATWLKTRHRRATPR
jgi:hypothetical protein